MDIGEGLEDEFSKEFSSDIESSYESSLESYYEQQRYPAERSPDDYYRHGPSSAWGPQVYPSRCKHCHQQNQSVTNMALGPYENSFALPYRFKPVSI